MNNHTDTIPWYRQPLVWMIIAIPSSAILAGIVTIYLAITTDDGLVADDYYKKGLAINRKIEREATATRLQTSAIVEIDTKEGFVKTKFNKGLLPEYPTRLQLALKHATQYQKDHFVTLQYRLDGQYVGSISSEKETALHEGIWHVELSNISSEGDEDWRLVKRTELKGISSVRLSSH